MVSMSSKKFMYAPPRLSEVSPTLAFLKQFQLSSDWRWPSPVLSSSASSVHASLLQAIDGVTSLALRRPQVVLQAPQHLDLPRQAICDGSISLGEATMIILIILVLFCLICMLPCHRPLHPVVLAKTGQGTVRGRNDFSGHRAHESETSTDEMEQI